MGHPSLLNGKGKIALRTTAGIHELICFVTASSPRHISLNTLIEFSTLYYCYLYVMQRPDAELRELLQKAMASINIDNLEHLKQVLFTAPKNSPVQLSKDSFRGNIALRISPEIHILLLHINKNDLKQGVINRALQVSVLYYCYLYVTQFPNQTSMRVLKKAMTGIVVNGAHNLVEVKSELQIKQILDLR